MAQEEGEISMFWGNYYEMEKDGFLPLNRYKLYLFAANYLHESKLDFGRLKVLLINIFIDSARVIKGMEEKLNSGDLSSFTRLFSQNIDEVEDDGLRKSVLKKYYNKQKKDKGKFTFIDYYIAILPGIVEYQNMVIEKFYIPHRDKLISENKGKIKTFLSYAFSDKGLSLALYLYFEIKNGFLFVDWMWNGQIKDGKKLKNLLDEELESSKQLLFLRTTASELEIKGNHTIRQWCSWEIGNYYTKFQEKKYMLAFYNPTTKNLFLDSFKIFNDVNEGIIN